MSQAIDMDIVDLSNARFFLGAGPERKLWMRVFLLALRDRAEAIRFVVDGSVVCLFYVIGGKEYELVPPPPHVAGRLMEVVRRRLESDPVDRRSSRLGLLVRKLFRRTGPTDDGEGAALPWSSNLRLQFGDALADVAATARAEGYGRVLTLNLSNVAIDSAAVAERLGVLMAEHHARKAAAAERSPVGPGTSE